MTDAELWCEGRPFCGRRPLLEAETRELEARIAKTRRRMTLTDRFTIGGVILLVGGVVVAAAIASHYDPSPIDTDDVIAVLGVLFLGLGCVGSLLEVILAPKVSTRLIFAAALIVFSIGAAIGEKTESTPIEAAITAAILIVLLGGSTMTVLRWRDRRRLRPVLEQAAQDCLAGEVLLFGPVEKPQIEILPTSHVAVQIDGIPAVQWKVTYVTSVSKTPQSFEAPVIGHTGEHVTAGGLIYNQRHMSSEEVVELGRIRKRTIRKGLVSTAAVTYTCALLLTTFGDRSTPVRWFIALLLGAMYFRKHWLVWRNLRTDVSTSMILVVRPSNEVEPSTSLAEVLPASHLEWTKNGAPSRWRVAKW